MVISGSNGEPTQKEIKMTTNGTNGHNTGPKKTAPKKASLKPEEKLRVRREALGLSRAKVADEAHVPVSRVWAAEHPDTGVAPDVRDKIVAVLNAHRDSIAKLPPIA